MIFWYWEPMYTSLHLWHSITWTTFFELQLKSLFIMTVVFLSFFTKIKHFPSVIILHTPHLSILHFIIPCVMCSPNEEEVSIFFLRFWFVSGFFITFVMSSISLILSLFLSSSRFFIISLYCFLGVFFIVGCDVR